MHNCVEPALTLIPWGKQFLRKACHDHMVAFLNRENWSSSTPNEMLQEEMAESMMSVEGIEPYTAMAVMNAIPASYENELLEGKAQAIRGCLDYRERLHLVRTARSIDTKAFRTMCGTLCMQREIESSGMLSDLSFAELHTSKVIELHSQMGCKMQFQPTQGPFSILHLSASDGRKMASLTAACNQIHNPLECDRDDCQMIGARFGQKFDVIPSTVRNSLELDNHHLDPYQRRILNAMIAIAEEGVRTGSFNPYEGFMTAVFGFDSNLGFFIRRIAQLIKESSRKRSTVTPTAKGYSTNGTCNIFLNSNCHMHEEWTPLRSISHTLDFREVDFTLRHMIAIITQETFCAADFNKALLSLKRLRWNVRFDIKNLWPWFHLMLLQNQIGQE